MIKIKKKKKTLLYEKYKQQKLMKLPNEVDVKDVKKNNEDDENKVKKEKKKKCESYKKLKKKITIDATLVITVCSLEAGIGCSHVAKSLAYFIHSKLKESVCIVDIKGLNNAPGFNGIEIFKREKLYNLYDQYKYIILDVGKYDAKDEREIKLSQIKIMCAIYDDNYLKNLASFIENIDCTKKWKYIFNHVPANKKQKVDELMEDFEYWCMPVNDAMNFSKKEKEAFYRLVVGGIL